MTEDSAEKILGVADDLLEIAAEVSEDSIRTQIVKKVRTIIKAAKSIREQKSEREPAVSTQMELLKFE